MNGRARRESPEACEQPSWIGRCRRPKSFSAADLDLIGSLQCTAWRWGIDGSGGDAAQQLRWARRWEKGSTSPLCSRRREIRRSSTSTSQRRLHRELTGVDEIDRPSWAPTISSAQKLTTHLCSGHWRPQRRSWSGQWGCGGEAGDDVGGWPTRPTARDLLLLFGYFTKEYLPT